MISEYATAQPDNCTSGTHTFANHTELLDDDDNDATPSQVVGTPTISIQRYPAQEQHPLPHLVDYISNQDETTSK